MGCWNKTCGISHLHIYAGDPVMVVPIEKNMDPTDRCYTTSFWRPVVVPFYAEYDDYGGGDNVTGFGADLFIEHLKKEMVDVDVGENKYHDIEVKAANMNIDLFFKAVHKNRLFVRSHYRNKELPPVDFVMIRKDIIDEIVKNYVIESYEKVDNNYQHVSWKFEDVVRDLPEFVERIQSKIKDDAYFRLDDMLDYASKNRAARLLRRMFGYHMSSIVSHIEFTKPEWALPENKEKLTELLHDVTPLMLIDAFMSATRRNWAPGGHEGSQDADHKGHLIMCDAIKTVLANERAKWEAEDGE